MEIRSTQSFNAISATIIRDIFTCIYQICHVNYSIVDILSTVLLKDCKYLSLWQIVPLTQ